MLMVNDLPAIAYVCDSAGSSRGLWYIRARDLDGEYWEDPVSIDYEGISPTLKINGWAMPRYTKLFSLVRHNWVAKLMHFPDAESLGIKCDRVRTFVRAALESSDGSEMGTAGVPGAMVSASHNPFHDNGLKVTFFPIDATRSSRPRVKNSFRSSVAWRSASSAALSAMR